jgi:hypothetical protein
MSNALTFRPNPSDLAKLKAELNQFAIATQDAIVRKAARKFASEEIARLAPRNRATLPPRDAKKKIKIFKSGVVWIAVGYKTGYGNYGDLGGRARRKAYDLEGTGWRSHFTELGFRSWAKGMRFGRSDEQRASLGKGWKRGLRHRGRGVYHRGTRASELVHYMMAPKLIGYLQDELRSEIAKRSNPRRVA